MAGSKDRISFCENKANVRKAIAKVLKGTLTKDTIINMHIQQQFH